MGVVICGNYGSDRVTEFETISCPHCQQVKAVVLKGCTKNVPYHYYCPRCREPICKECAEYMEKLGQCPGPFRAKIDEALRRQAWDDHFVYHYHSTLR